MKTIYPAPDGRFIPGVPAIEQEVSNERAKELVESGAFTYDKPTRKPEPPPAAEPEEA